MTNPLSTNHIAKRSPVLLVGLGGTGVRSLRYALWMAQNGQDPGLAAMLEEGRLQTVAVDTDWKANLPDAQVPDYIFPRSSQRRRGEGEVLRQLPRLPRLVTVQTEDISRAMEGIRHRRRQGAMRANTNATRWGEDPLATAALAHGLTGQELEESLSWFPLDDVRLGEEINIGQARHEGAGQWRPLGRLGLFLEARAIMDELREGHKRVRDATPNNRPVRAVIIGSLSGGTGSGMFWDVAFMLRMIDPDCNITGSFLLADPFTGSDRAERIEINAYAALKELAGLKNWRQKTPIKVRYPIGAQGIMFQREPGGRPVFDIVYIYQSFEPEVNTADVDDVHKAAVETSCYRIAQNVLTQIRQDIRARIDEGANNERSDANAPGGHREQGNVFCTSAMAPLDLLDADYLTNILEVRFLNGLLDRLTGAGMPQVGRDAIGKLMQERVKPRIEAPIPPPQAADLPAAPRAAGPDGAVIVAIPQPPTDPDGWMKEVQNLKEEAGKLRPPTEFKTIKRLKERMDDLARAAAALAHPDLERDRERKTALAREIYAGHVPFTLRNAWQQSIQSGSWTPDNSRKAGGGPKAAISVMELLKDDIEEHWQRIEDWISGIADDLKKHLAVFDLDTQRQLSLFIDRLDELGGSPEPNDVEVEAPASLIHMRAALGLYREDDREGHEADLQRLFQRYGCGPIDRMMAVFAAQLSSRIDQVGQSAAVRNHFPQAFCHYVSTHLDEIKGRFRALLDLSEANRSKREQRARQVYGRGYGGLRTVFTDAASHFDEFDKAMKPLSQALRRLTTDPSGSALDNVVKGLADATIDVARGIDTTQSGGFSVPNDSLTLWRLLLERLDWTFREQEQHPGETVPPLIDLLAQMIEQAFCGWENDLPLPVLTDPAALEHRLIRVRTALTAFVRFWMEQEEFVLQRLGGETGLVEAMGRCRSRVFGKGALVSSIQQDKLVIAKPVSAHITTTYDQRNGRVEGLSRAIAMAAQNALNQTPSFAGESSRPVIYFEQLFRAGVEVLNIERYHQRYMDVPPERRGRFHLFPEALDLPDLLEQGTYDPDARASWPCTDPAHHGIMVAFDEPHCPRCLDEYIRGTRPWSAVRHNPRDTGLECPACAAHEAPAVLRGKVPDTLQHFFHNGVGPGEVRNFDALRDHLGSGIWCPNTTTGRHILYPATVRVASDGTERIAYLHRDGNDFVSSRDGSRYEHHCFHCDFPISPWQLAAIRDGRMVTCPRCQRELRECPYCTHRDGALFKPLSDFHGPDRCPRCSNIMHRHVPELEPMAREGLKRAAFCRNLFGCPAGARPWTTATDYEKHEHCDACRDQQHPAVLLPWDELRPIVDRCPVCLTLIGLPDSGHLHRFEASELASHFHRQDDPDPSKPCVVCGTEPAAVLYWMLETGFFDDADPRLDTVIINSLRARVPGPYTVPRIDARNGMDLLEALWRHPDDRELFEALRELPGIVNPRRRFADLERDMRRLLVGKSIAPRVVMERLKNLGRIEDDIRARIEGRGLINLPR